jgi:hypothetical protein
VEQGFSPAAKNNEDTALAAEIVLQRLKPGKFDHSSMAGLRHPAGIKIVIVLKFL